MRDFFKSCVDLYADLTGTNPNEYPKVPTPFGPEAAEIEYGVGGVTGRTCPPAEEALADLLGLPHPVEPTMQQVVESVGMEYEAAAVAAAAAAIGYQEKERIDEDMAVHVRYLHGQNHYVAYESANDPRWQGTVRRVTIDTTRGGPGGQVIADEEVSQMSDNVLFRRLPRPDMDIRVELYYLPEALRPSDESIAAAAPSMGGDPSDKISSSPCPRGCGPDNVKSGIDLEQPGVT